MENNNEQTKDMNMHRPHCKMQIIALVLSIISIMLSCFTLGFTVSHKQVKHNVEKEKRYSYTEENPFFNNNARPFFENKGPSSENKTNPFSNKQFGNFPSFRNDENKKSENGSNENR